MYFFPKSLAEGDEQEDGDEEREYGPYYWEDGNDNSTECKSFDQIILDDELVDNFQFDYDGYGTYHEISNELDVMKSSVQIIYDDKSGFDLQLGEGYKEGKRSDRIILNDELLDDFQFDFNAYGAYPIISDELNDMKRSENGEEKSSNGEKKTFNSVLRSICWVFCCCFNGKAT
ncbi:uncharacterized protein [Parasteatoda tepidariorum]|uniref:uncharacterized protein n=1 Tax=Parasteatoda tepidariorum TaxID=114398 RepID=UPI00077F9C1C